MTRRLTPREMTYPRRRINEALVRLIACPACVTTTTKVESTGKTTIRFKCMCGLAFTVPLDALNTRLGLGKPKA